MNCQCLHRNLYELKLEGDAGADPIWCIHCGRNLEPEDLPIPLKIQKDLAEWALLYGEWIDWEKDSLFPNAPVLERQHNEDGRLLAEKLKNELGASYTLVFSPSDTVRSYMEKQQGSRNS